MEGVGFQRGGGFEQMRQRAVCKQLAGALGTPTPPFGSEAGKAWEESRFQFPVKLHQVSMQEGEENMQRGWGAVKDLAELGC